MRRPGLSGVRGRSRLTAIARSWWQVLRAAVVGVWEHGRTIELLQRSMAFAALFFVTLVPLLIVIAAAFPRAAAGSPSGSPTASA